MRLASLLKPEYVMNPAQLARRVGWTLFPPKQGRIVTRTPWGWPIEVYTHDDIGKGLIHLGVFDLVVSEVLWRLCDPEETALDLGANVGYMTALLAKRVGPKGRVLSFEAHPEIARELTANAERWRQYAGPDVIQAVNVALSDREGFAQLECPPEFARNRGLSRIQEGRDGDTASSETMSVACARLDSFLPENGVVGVAKMDVEGHEESVLRGTEQALRAGSIRDWVFEHHETYPSPVTALFETHGYALFQIHKRFARAELAPVSQPRERSRWEAQSFLATKDPARAVERLRDGGWRVLASRRQSP